jgi:hypothetical protein
VASLGLVDKLAYSENYAQTLCSSRFNELATITSAHENPHKYKGILKGDIRGILRG